MMKWLNKKTVWGDRITNPGARGKKPPPHMWSPGPAARLSCVRPAGSPTLRLEIEFNERSRIRSGRGDRMTLHVPPIRLTQSMQAVRRHQRQRRHFICCRSGKVFVAARATPPARPPRDFPQLGYLYLFRLKCINRRRRRRSRADA